MNEDADDLTRLQALLDASYEAAGSHLLSIHTPERRLVASEVVDRLTGMCLLTLATTATDGRPLTGPVDGVFHRGEFWFGSSPTSLRARHIARDRRVSVTHLAGEHLGVVAHGTVADTLLAPNLPADLQASMVGIYGESWRDWGSDAVYWRLDADRMFTFHLDPEET